MTLSLRREGTNIIRENPTNSVDDPRLYGVILAPLILFGTVSPAKRLLPWMSRRRLRFRKIGCWKASRVRSPPT
jgi:hypothetical protein